MLCLKSVGVSLPLNGRTNDICAKLQLHFMHHLETVPDIQSQLFKLHDLQLFSRFPNLFFFFLLMNLSSKGTHNRDNSNEQADNTAAILTDIKQSGG